MTFEMATVADPNLSEDAFDLIYNSGRPLRVNKDGRVQLQRPNGLVVNSLLRKDEWEELDRQIEEAVRHDLRGVNDLIGAGLTNSVGLGTLISQWQTGSRMTKATVNMTGQTTGERDRLEFDIAGVPVPVTHKEFSIGRRQLEASRKLGNQLDLTHVQEATYSVAWTLEDMLFGGDNLVFNGAAIYGYTTHPNRLTDTATNYGGGVITGSGGDPANIVGAIAGAIQALNAEKFYGPFTLYLPTEQYNAISMDFYTDGTVDTPMQRIMRFPQLGSVREIPEETLTAGTAVLVAMRRTVVDWTQAMGVSAMEWSSEDNMSQTFKVMSVAVPRIKSNSNSKTGIVHITGLDGG